MRHNIRELFTAAAAATAGIGLLSGLANPEILGPVLGMGGALIAQTFLFGDSLSGVFARERGTGSRLVSAVSSAIFPLTLFSLYASSNPAAIVLSIFGMTASGVLNTAVTARNLRFSP